MSAQEPEARSTIAIFQPDSSELKQYLGLTDAQLKTLQSIQQQRQEAAQKVYEQINQKRQALSELLRTNSRDALRIGQLTLEINDLQKQATQPAEPHRSQALAALTQDQRSKLAPLGSALQLGPTAHQAVYLNLLDSPAPRPMPLRSGLGIVGAEPGDLTGVITNAMILPAPITPAP